MLQHVTCCRGCLTNSFGQTHPSALSARSGQPRRCEWRSVVAQRHCAHRMCTSMMICGALRGACCVPCAAWHKCCGMQRRTAEPSAGRPRGSAGLAAQRQSLCCSLSPRTAPSPSRRCSVVPHLPSGLRSRVAHRHQAQPCRICTGTGPNPCHICTGTGLTPCHICPGLRPPLPHLQSDRLGIPSSIVGRPEGHARSGGGKAARAALTTLLSILHSCRQRQGLVSAVPVQMWQVNRCAVRAAACCKYMLYVASCYCTLQGARCVRHIARCAIACMPHF